MQGWEMQKGCSASRSSHLVNVATVVPIRLMGGSGKKGVVLDKPTVSLSSRSGPPPPFGEVWYGAGQCGNQLAT